MCRNRINCDDDVGIKISGSISRYRRKKTVIIVLKLTPASVSSIFICWSTLRLLQSSTDFCTHRLGRKGPIK